MSNPASRIDAIESTRGQVALRRGPLVFAVEEVDQDLDKTLPREASLNARWEDDLLHGTMVVTGTWADGSALLAIPYFQRKNRDADGQRSLSRVWIQQN